VVLLRAAPRALTPLALLAALLALALPSAWFGAHSDLLLALLVLATALGIPVAELARLRDHTRAVVFLSLVPLLVLAAVAWALGRPFSSEVQHGLLACGLSSAEVAAVGLVALAGADATIALGVVTGSLVLAAVVGPLAVGALASGAGHAAAGRLLGRFSLVVLVPLLAGVALRSIRPLGPRLAAVDGEREGVGALAVAVLVYAALSGTRRVHDLGGVLLASAAFLAVSAALAELWRRRIAAAASGGGDAAAVPGALTIAMRDFAVAAALAQQAFGGRAGAVPGVYGVLMLVGGTVAAGRLRRGGGDEARGRGRASLSQRHTRRAAPDGCDVDDDGRP
jgi:bile acid:Na+ symporter, BASS family